MNTTAIRQPSTNPFDLVTFDPIRHADHIRPIESILGTFRCQAITHSGKACERQATTKAWGSGPRRSGHILLCKSHGASRYLASADPSL